MSVAWRAGLRPAMLLGGLVVAGLALRLMPAEHLLGAASGVASGNRPILFMAGGAALCAVGVPRQIICYAAGAAFGAVPGIAIALAAQMLGCAADLAWARAIGQRWVAARLRGRLARLDAALSRRPFLSALSLRLLPVGSNLLLNLAAGVSGVPALPFLAATLIGYLPQTAVFALAGSGVHMARGGQLALAAGLLAASVALGIWLLRRDRARA